MPVVGPRAAADCAALFGAGDRGEAARRRQRIYWVHEEENGITVAHSNDSWSEPAEVELRGLRLLHAGKRALVRVTPAVAAAVGCAAGDYTVAEDDGVGRGLHVLSVLRAGLLLERDGRLVYWRAPQVRGDGPRWFLAWSQVGKVKVPEGNGPTVDTYGRRRAYGGYGGGYGGGWD